MTEDQAKAQLAVLLAQIPLATVVHFTADLVGGEALKAADYDPDRAERLREVAATLVVMGLGIQAAVVD